MSAGWRLERRRWGGWPAPADPAQYEAAVADYVDRVLPRPSVLGIHQFGSVRTPGISDIDLVVVLRPGMRENPRELDRAWQRSPHARLWAHGPLILDEPLFADLAGLFPAFDCRRVAGEGDVPPLRPPLPRYRLVHMARLILLKVPRSLVTETALQPGVDARLTILLLSSFGHTLRMVEAEGGVDPSGGEWRSFQAEVDALRAEWFALPADEIRQRCAELARSAVRVGQQAAGEVARLLEEHVASTTLVGGQTLRVGGYLPAEAVAAWDWEAEAERMLHASSVRSRVRIPAAIAGFLAAVAERGDGPYERHLRSMVPAGRLRVEVRPEAPPLLDLHRGLVNRYIAFYRDALDAFPSPYMALGAGEGVARRVARTGRDYVRGAWAQLR